MQIQILLITTINSGQYSNGFAFRLDFQLRIVRDLELTIQSKFTFGQHFLKTLKYQLISLSEFQ